ncbi:MAG: nitroreductase family protein [Armatimonadota bacterium]|nr:nitroreductase family protein [Armatimonadota bacterium]MDR7452547.1 nitroreductase family protein [Armatimonadota bacterium]MDR7466877.1 nitroreductase family protein [Armatimonadota bacterium]MDR7492650.1 nitroreductase family protein [Armatimonadota bacterium]MDR7499988.1 nitroreductase family protein [Armatimonadota bacterium]
MDTYRCIVTKRDLRTFTDRPIPDRILRRILDAGRRSGSSRNSQPWHFVVVRDRSRLRTLAGFGRFAQHVATAAAAVGLVVDSPRALFDAGRCAQNMMLAAWNEGVASCPATMHDAAGAGALLGIPAGHVIATVISLGYPHPGGRGPIERAVLRILAGRGRRPLSTMVSWERYGASARGRRGI